MGTIAYLSVLFTDMPLVKVTSRFSLGNNHRTHRGLGLLIGHHLDDAHVLCNKRIT